MSSLLYVPTGFRTAGATPTLGVSLTTGPVAGALCWTCHVHVALTPSRPYAPDTRVESRAPHSDPDRSAWTAGVRLFDHLGAERIDLETIHLVDSPVSRT
jgi:hypothetical protein